MVLYNPDCDSNDCELQSGQATLSTLAKGVVCGEHELHVHVGRIRTIDRAARWLVRVIHQGPVCVGGSWVLAG